MRKQWCRPVTWVACGMLGSYLSFAVQYALGWWRFR